MIYVDRNSFPAPNILQSDEVEKELKDLEYYYEDIFAAEEKGVDYSDFNFDFTVFRDPVFVVYLRTLFKDKCAYCETALKELTEKDTKSILDFLPEYMDIDLFRPRHRATNLDNEVSIECYWWLAYEWNNIYLCCPTCYHNKGTRFPIEGIRASFDGDDDLSKEAPYLLDPCDSTLKEGVEAHLQFYENGIVEGKSKRGYISIHILGLNRPPLIKDRRETIANFLSMHRALLEAQEKGRIKEALELENIKQEILEKSFTAAKTQVLRRMTEQGLTEQDKENSYQLNHEEEEELNTLRIKRITTIKLKNFRNIGYLNLQIANKMSPTEPWLVLLGENGTGKSSILQAVAIALMGTAEIERMGLKVSDYLSFKEEITSGNVQLIFESGDHIEVSFSKQSNQFQSKLTKNNKVSALISSYDTFCGFGATRLFSPKKYEVSRVNYNIGGLFDPYIRPIDYIKWLADLYRDPNPHNRRVFRDITIALKKILLLEEEIKTEIISKKVEADTYDLFLIRGDTKHLIRLRHLSSGYQSVLFLFLGIVKSSFEKWDSPFVIDSIILIDEIGVHLHPEWKMRIVRQLREVFMHATFIISTHEPLCLRGIEEKEVILLEEDEDGEIIATTDLPAPSTMRIGQLLTSVFGLRTTMDPVLSRYFEEYAILNMIVDRNAEQVIRYNELKAELETFIDENGNLNRLLGSDAYAKIYFKEAIKRDFIKKPSTFKSYKPSTIAALKKIITENN